MIRIWLSLVLLLTFASFAAQAEEMVETRLYFGLQSADGEKVSKKGWENFLVDDVTPRFRDGYTVVDARGLWKSQSGESVAERSKLLIIVHPKSQKAINDIAAIKWDYVKRFKQESVFHTESVVNVVK